MLNTTGLSGLRGSVMIIGMRVARTAATNGLAPSSRPRIWASICALVRVAARLGELCGSDDKRCSTDPCYRNVVAAAHCAWSRRRPSMCSGGVSGLEKLRRPPRESVNVRKPEPIQLPLVTHPPLQPLRHVETGERTPPWTGFGSSEALFSSGGRVPGRARQRECRFCCCGRGRCASNRRLHERLGHDNPVLGIVAPIGCAADPLDPPVVTLTTTLGASWRMSTEIGGRRQPPHHRFASAFGSSRGPRSLSSARERRREPKAPTVA